MFYRFPEYFEVRFVQHLINLKGGDQEYYTAFMMDILRQFEKLQKQGQKSMTTLCDVETTKTEVLESLTLIKSNCFPCGKGEDLKNKICGTELENEKDDDNIQTRTIRNSCFNKTFAIEMISSVRCDVEGLFDKTNLSQFSDEVLGLYAAENLPAPRNITDFTGKLYYYLKISTPNTLFSKLVCGPERAVSCHTVLKTNKQPNYSREAINSHLYIALNSSGTAYFDPRPSVARFLQNKQRRKKLPDKQAYKDHFYIKKFFEEV
ncbi:hypothetical protein QTP88_004215 [Uroleucon formosanum]